MKRFAALIIPLVLVILACGSQQTGIDTAIAQTKAYEANLATALAGTMAAAAPTTAPAAQNAPPTVAPPPASLPSPTVPPATAPANFLPGTIPLEWGQNAATLPRQATVVYGFQGTQNEVAALSFVLSQGAIHEFCVGRGRNLVFSVKTDKDQVLDGGSLRTNGSVTKSVTLPYTGVYYVNMTCNGSGCDGFCAEMSVALAKK